MKIDLVFSDWQKSGQSLPTEEGMELSLGVFHPGTAFKATIELTPADKAEFTRALQDGYEPGFWVALPESTD